MEADVFRRSSSDVSSRAAPEISRQVPLPSGWASISAIPRRIGLKTFADMRLMLILGIVLVYMVMAAQFESLLDPFLILFSILRLHRRGGLADTAEIDGQHHVIHWHDHAGGRGGQPTRSC